MPVDLIIFDLDGTLIDSIEDITNALNHVFRPFLTSPLVPGEVAGMIGEGAHRLVEKVLRKHHLSLPVDPLVEEYTERYTEHLMDRTLLYPDVSETLAALASCLMALVSNKTELLSRRILEAFGLGRYFESVVCADTIPYRKPSPEPLLHVLSTLGVPVGHAVMVGDSETDIAAGKACSMRTIAVTHGYGRPGFEEKADFIVQGFRQLAPLIRSLP